MIEGIKQAKDRKMADVQAIKNSGKPVIMYGAGSYAADVTKFLKNQNIQVGAYCVDAAYAKPGQTFMNLPVMSVEEAYKKYPDSNVIIGFADYKRAREVLSGLDDKRDMYFIDAPNQLGFFDYQYIQDHMDEFEQTWNWLEDQRSRDIMVAFINAKLAGDPSPLYDFYEKNQYFVDPIKLTDHETFVDCGAYDGDTIKSIIENTGGKYRKIFAFEPETANYERLQKYLADNNVKNVEVHNAGTWSEKTTLSFSSDSNMAAIVADANGDISISVEAIDDVVGPEEVTFIKMDIEGAELESLRGAEQTIRQNKPKLTICVYHKPEDLITIPQYIKSLAPDYKFYLRHHQMMSWEMVLYAIPA